MGAVQASGRRAVVVGGGIAGLAAAWRLGRDHPGFDVLLLEATDRVGGKLRREQVGGVVVDVGAEAMLARRPEGVALAQELGLEVVHPTAAPSRLWSRGALRPLPRSLLGIPLDLDDLAASGVLSAEGLARVRREPSLPPTRPLPAGGDVTVAELVADRLGEEVVDRLVEPLLGGVYAGHARRLGVRAAVPALVPLLGRGSLLTAAAALPVADGPVFAGLAGGLAGLADALAGSGRFRVRTGAVARQVRRTGTGDGTGFEVVLGDHRRPEALTADLVVLATPAPATARLLAGLAPAASAALARVELASTAVVTLAYPVEAVAALAGSSGFLVPPVEGRRVKASTFSFAKWDWVREAGSSEGVALLRTSLGRHGEERLLQATDEELVAWSRADLAEATGLAAAPVAVHVQRWGGALPQYLVGHLDLVEEVRRDVARVPGLAVCGAAYDGVGVPAVVGSAARAVAALGAAAQWEA